MSKQFDQEKLKKKLKKQINKKYGKNFKFKTKSSNGFYFLGFLGSAIYFMSHANGFWDGVLGFLKAIIWPVFLVYEAFAKFLGA